MSEGKVGVDYVVGFDVRLGTGLPATGIAPGDFTPTVRALDTAVDDGAVAAVVEIGSGRYSLIIRGVFTTAQAAGNYKWQVSVNSTTPFVRDITGGTIRFLANDEDDLAADVAALNDLSIADVQTALTNQGYTGARAILLDNLDATISSVITAIGALNDISIADVQTALTNQGYTAARALLLDNLDAAISSRAAPGDAMTLTGAQVIAVVDAIWDEDIVAAHGTAATAGLLLRVLGALIATRANNATLNALLGVADTPGTDLPEQIDTELTAAHGAGQWDAISALTAQDIRDAMKLTPTVGAPAAGSVDIHLDDILADTAAVEPLVTANLDATVSSRESTVDAAARETAILAAIGALNDLSIADVQTALTNQGYTSVRAVNLDNLDTPLAAAITSVLVAIAALNDLSVADVDTAISANSAITILRKVITNKRVTNPVTERLEIWNDATSAVEFSIPIFEDVAEAQGYRGLGIDVQEKIV